MAAELFPIGEGTGMEPSLSTGRWDVPSRFYIWGFNLGHRRKVLRVSMLHWSKATELSLDSVEEPVVMVVAGHESILGDEIYHLEFLYALYRESETRKPGNTILLVPKIEFC